MGVVNIDSRTYKNVIEDMNGNKKAIPNTLQHLGMAFYY